jgi:hypothetical protein
MASICLTLGSHLSQSPRATRSATSLALAGHDVLVLSPIFTSAGAEEDARLTREAPWRYEATVDLRPEVTNAVARFRYRAVRRLSAEMVRRGGVQMPCALAYAVMRTLRVVRSRDWDLHIGFQELGAYASFCLGKRGRRVAIDIEDWYSRDLLPEAQRERPKRLLSRIEQFALNGAEHSFTTSGAMAAALQRAYGGRVPTVVYNAFPFSDRKDIDGLMLDRVDQSKRSLHWASKTIGAGRGLETLCEALKFITAPVEVHLRGNCAKDFELVLRDRFPKNGQHTLHFHKPVPANQLLSRMAEHDIGLALEMDNPESRNLTVTYKFFHYLLAGLAIVASDTAGQAEAAACCDGAVSLFKVGDAKALASQVNSLLSSHDLEARKAKAVYVSKEIFSWEKQGSHVVDAINLLFSH